MWVYWFACIQRYALLNAFKFGYQSAWSKQLIVVLNQNFILDRIVELECTFPSNAINYKIYCKQKQFFNRPLMIGKMIFECYLSGGYRESIFFIWNNVSIRTCTVAGVFLLVFVNSIDTRDAWQGSSPIRVAYEVRGDCQVQLSCSWTQRGLRDSASDFNDQITIVPFHVPQHV